MNINNRINIKEAAMNFCSLDLIVLAHGLVTFVFTLVLLLEGFKIALPLISLKTKQLNFFYHRFTQRLRVYSSLLK